MKLLRIAAPIVALAALSLIWVLPASAANHTPSKTGTTVTFPTVKLGYAAGTGSHFPNPWKGSPDITFIGALAHGKLKGSEKHGWDTSGLLLFNNGKKALHVARVRVRFPARNKKVSPWGSFTVPPGKSVILASTDSPHGGNFDGSEKGYQHLACGTMATTKAPRVRIRMAGGQLEILKDTGHVLDAGGYNPGRKGCHQNESQTWRAPGAAAGPFV